jgi:hypothetical protein
MGTTSAATFAARPRTALAFLTAGGIAAAVGYTLDTPGRLLLSALAFVSLLEGMWLLLARPVLSADGERVRVRTAVRVVAVPWSAVGAVQARPARRVIAGDTLELELGDQLVVIPAYRLGATAAEAAAAVEAARPVSS